MYIVQYPQCHSVILFYIRFADDCSWHGPTQLVFFFGELFQNMFGICHRDSGGGGGEFGAAPDGPLFDALIEAFNAIVLCSMVWLVAVATAAAAAATANADKSFSFFFFRFRAAEAVQIGSTHITCVWFFLCFIKFSS